MEWFRSLVSFWALSLTGDMFLASAVIIDAATYNGQMNVEWLIFILAVAGAGSFVLSRILKAQRYGKYTTKAND